MELLTQILRCPGSVGIKYKFKGGKNELIFWDNSMNEGLTFIGKSMSVLWVSCDSLKIFVANISSVLAMCPALS